MNRQPLNYAHICELVDWHFGSLLLRAAIGRASRRAPAPSGYGGWKQNEKEKQNENEY